MIGSFDQLPAAVDLVWHGVNDRQNLSHYLASKVQWAELDINLDRSGDQFILRHDSFDQLPPMPDEEYLPLDDVLAEMRIHNRSVKLDFKVGDPWIQQILRLVDKCDFAAKELWFNGNLEILGQKWISTFAEGYPGAVVQVPLGFLVPLKDEPEAAKRRLEEVARWGVNRFSLSWRYPQARQLFAQVTQWGYALNIYGVENLTEFLEAVALQPRSVTCDFNFPEWGLFGRGSGHRGFYHEYPPSELDAGNNHVTRGFTGTDDR